MRFDFYKLVFLLALLVCPAAVAQQITISDGVYTEAQAQSGQLLYEQNCMTCHDLRFYENNLNSWDGMTVLDYWYKILGNMPADKPGSLSRTEYLELIAFILRENGFPAGETPLQPSNHLGKIKFVSIATKND
ncbi:MAG: cytochrome c [Gammaproteobacteria bacterium]|nr:hypothetical protein [Gammaproteobacteria bacterium]MDP6096099.1 cytochrome c [Gammaproteobacteria bacterium]